MENYISGEWQRSAASETLLLLNPATGEELGRTPLSPAADVGTAVDAAARAFPAWRRVPVTERIQFLFKLKPLLEQQFEELARTITLECGKTLAESRGEIRRAIENVEVACGAPTMIQGYNSEDIAVGIDETMIRQPLGVCAIIAPFNFPAMIPFWFLPYALAAGNTVVIKPSERVPLDDAARVSVAGFARPAEGRGQSRQRRPRGGRCAARSSHRARRQLRRIERRRPPRLRARRGQRQARPGAGRRQESRRAPAGCGCGVKRGNRRRQRVRLRGPTLPGGGGRHYRGRAPPSRLRRLFRSTPSSASPATAWTRASKWAQ